jgi:hypothetical protein
VIIASKKNKEVCRSKCTLNGKNNTIMPENFMAWKYMENLNTMKFVQMLEADDKAMFIILNSLERAKDNYFY